MPLFRPPPRFSRELRALRRGRHGHPRADLGQVRLVSTPFTAKRFAPLDSRAFAIDYFTTDLDHSIAIANEAHSATASLPTSIFSTAGKL